MKFNINVKQGEDFITVGNIRPNKSGKSWSLTIFADKTGLLQRSPCGKYINALVVEDKRPDFGGNGTPKGQAATVADWLPQEQGRTATAGTATLTSDSVPF